MGKRRDVQEEGARNRGTIVAASCRKCGRLVELKVPTTPVSLLNQERERAERAEEQVRQLCSYVKEAAGDESVLVPVSTLSTLTERGDRIERNLLDHLEALRGKLRAGAAIVDDDLLVLMDRASGFCSRTHG